jgi:dTDP-4-dehydrorhamnose 3,5-epimerase
MMNVLMTELPGVLIIEPRVFPDSRGCFFETFQAERYQQQGIPARFVQDNFSRSTQHVVRGLHYQLEHPQGKLVFVTYGRVLDIVVDVRWDSPTFGKAITIELNDQQARQVYIPPGFAHGFCVLSERADFIYKCTDYYYPAGERGILWNDPDLAIAWPVPEPILSIKDAVYPRLKDIAKDQLPRVASA